MLKKIKTLILIASLCLLLNACIQISPAQPTGPVTSPTVSTSAGIHEPALPVWSAEETAAAAQIFLNDKDTVVDITHQKYSYGELEQDLQTFAERFSDHFSYRVIGQSVAGRNLYLAVLGNPDAPRQIVVSAAIHAREYMTAQLVMKQIEFYLVNYQTGSYKNISYAGLFEEFCFYIVPMTNPDGVMISQQGLDSLPTEQMKTTLRQIFQNQFEYKSQSLYFSHWKANANGVDLNRNYDALWEQYSQATKPQSSQYKGPAPASEPETRAMVSLIETLPSVACVLCIHSQGEVIYWNCGQPEQQANRTRNLAKAIAARNGYYVEPDQNNDASFSDWCELKHSIPSVTVETGNEMCPLSIEQFPQIWLDNFDLLPLTAYFFRSTL